MIVYQATKSQFLKDTTFGDIERIVGDAFEAKLGWQVSPSEVRSWKESLKEVARVLADDDIPAAAGIAVEYNIPQTSKRVDVLISGRNAEHDPRVIVVELKQWQKAELSRKDAIVETFINGASREVSHPSYQAWSYVALLEGFNEEVYTAPITLAPCAYLHNYQADSVILHDHYAPYIERAPVFLQGAAERGRLASFIKQHVKYGDDQNLLYRMENSRIRPSKMLAESLSAMLKGSPEFVLIDDQKVVYESALALARTASGAARKVLIVRGGPGTGKSVVAVNLLATLTSEKQNCRYVSKNSAPREVFEARLTRHFRATYIRNLFSGSGAFIESPKDTFDTLIVDEAHRLNEKSGLYGNKGFNQIAEIIRAAPCAIFFVDEDQRVTLKDIGTVDAIRSFALEAGASVTEMALESQFRCSGSDGYLAWLDDVLGVRATANKDLEPGFEFRVVGSPEELHRLIAQKNRSNNKARVVAGYCWDWVSRKATDAFDIVIPGTSYRRQWNLDKDGKLWIMAPGSVEQVGCIHTCQGLEVDYVGVLVGDDFVVRKGQVVCRPEKRSRHDSSIRGWKTAMKEEPERTKAQLDAIIKNTYRTLMTRGIKGCYVYCTDPETSDYFRKRLGITVDPRPARALAAAPNVIPFRLVRPERVKPFKNAVPLVDLKFAAGAFSGFQALDADSAQWIELPDHLRPQPGLFVAQVVGESMNRRVPNGAWCLFRLNPMGTRVGKVVVAQHRRIEDPEMGGDFTIKVYRSRKESGTGGEWTNVAVTLEPDSTESVFKPLEFGPEAAAELVIVAELIDIL